MGMVVSRVAFSAVLLGWALVSLAEEERTPPTDISTDAQNAVNFRLTTASNQSWELHHQGDFKAVALMAFDPACGVSCDAAKVLESLRIAHATELSVAGINVQSGRSRAEVQARADEIGVKYPVLMDPTQDIARGLGFTRAGEVVLIDPASGWHIGYRGPANDADGNSLISAALDAQLAGKTITQGANVSSGTEIAYHPPAEVSYAKDIVPILQSKCLNCHHDGGLGPFAMKNYNKVHGWADMIGETIRTKRMPPWHADPEMGKFMNSRGLSDAEEAKLLAWVSQGAPKDGDSDPLPDIQPPPGRPAWQMGEPDQIVRLPERQHLPAEGVIPYRYIPVETSLSEDKWLRSVEVRSDNQAVVHHALIFVLYPKEYRHIQPEAQSGLNGYFASYLPGAQLYNLPSNAGIFLPKGSVFMFQMHYNATGKPEEEQCEMGLYFHDAPPEKAVMIQAAAETHFEIPANAPDYEVRSSYRFRENAEILGLSPHMHYRGSRFQFAANYPDGESEVLLNVPLYEFDWQPMYILEKPLPVPEGTRIDCIGGYDNSRFNPKNPAPGQAVSFGEQSYEEMFIGYVEFTIPRDPAVFSPRQVRAEDYPGLGQAITPESIVGMQFRIQRDLAVEFLANGRLKQVGGLVIGSYEFESPTRIAAKSFVGDVDLSVIGDELFLHGHPLRRVM